MNLPDNPIVSGFYADPEARFYQGQYWIYATRSHTDYTQQLNIDAFSSADLIHWEKHEGVIQMTDFPWIWRAVWAPTIIEKGGCYFLVFASNDILNDEQIGGLELAVSDSPAGPFRGLLGKSMIDRFIGGAQPIDAHLFKDDDGTVYLYYGGWKHCNVAVMNAEMTGIVPGSLRGVTPDVYFEAPCMIKRNGKYFLMWSQGDWVDGTYSVAYGVSDNPFGPFEARGVVLSSQPPIAEGPGHHGYLHLPETDDWLIVYHRRVIGNTDPGARVLCIDKLEFEQGIIKPVVMT